MDYERVYREFIADRRLREYLLTTGFDRHHVLPRHLGGSNDAENIVKLTYADHLFAHILLAKSHGGVMAVCANRMSGMEKYRGRRSRERYAHLRAAHRAAVTGKKLSDKHREALRGPRPDMRGNQRAARPKTAEHRARIGAAHVGMKRSEETKAKLRAVWARRKANKENQDAQ